MKKKKLGTIKKNRVGFIVLTAIGIFMSYQAIADLILG